MGTDIRNDLGLNRSYKSSFDNEKNYYANTTYNTFSSGYISNCSDSYIQRMKNNLSPIYQSISDSYTKINTWWDKYNADTERLENGLNNNRANGNGINEATVRASVFALPELKNFKYEFKNTYQKHYSQSAIPIKNIDLGKKVQDSKKGFDIKKHYSDKAQEVTNIKQNIDRLEKGIELKEHYSQNMGPENLEEWRDNVWEQNQKLTALDELERKTSDIVIKAVGDFAGDVWALVQCGAVELFNDLSTGANYMIKTTSTYFSSCFQMYIEMATSGKIMTPVEEFNRFKANYKATYAELNNKTMESYDAIKQKQDEIMNAQINRKNEYSAEDYIKKMPTTLEDVGLSFAEGSVSVGEQVRDTVTSLGDDIFTPITWIYGKTNGLSNTNLTNTINELHIETMTEIAENQCQTYLFDPIDNSEHGKYIKENSILDDTGRGVVQGLGQMSTQMVLTFSPAAAANGMVTVSPVAGGIMGGITGYGEGIQSAYADGASYTNGKVYAVVNSVIESSAWYSGMKINTLWRAEGMSSKYYFNAIRKRILLDVTSAGIEATSKTLAHGIYIRKSDGSKYSLAEIWQKYDGTNAVITNMAVAYIGSRLGEVSETIEAKGIRQNEKAAEKMAKKIAKSSSFVDSLNDKLFDKKFIGGDQSSLRDKFAKSFKTKGDKQFLGEIEDILRKYYHNFDMGEVAYNIENQGCTYQTFADCILYQLEKQGCTKSDFIKIFGFDPINVDGKNNDKLIADIFGAINSKHKIRITETEISAKEFNFSDSINYAKEKLNIDFVSNAEAFSALVKNQMIHFENGTPYYSLRKIKDFSGSYDEAAKKLFGLENTKISTKEEFESICRKYGYDLAVKDDSPGQKIFPDGKVTDYVKKYLKDHGLEIESKKLSGLPDISDIKKYLADGYEVTIGTKGGKLKTNNIFDKINFQSHLDGIGHEMRVVGVSETGELIVSTGGKYFNLDLNNSVQTIYNVFKIKPIVEGLFGGESINMTSTVKSAEIVDILSNKDISALLADASGNTFSPSWSKRELSQRMHQAFDGILGSENVDIALNNISKVDKNSWQQFLKEHNQPEFVLGFVDGNHKGFLPSDATKHSATHEALHGLSEMLNIDKKVIDINGVSHKITGIREYYNDGTNSNFANEALTEYLASKWDDGLLYGSMYDISNARRWSRVDDAIKRVAPNSYVLEQAYMYNDVSGLRKFFADYSTKGSYDDFVRAMPDYYGNGKKVMDDILSSIELNIIKEQRPLLGVLKEIFGGK